MFEFIVEFSEDLDKKVEEVKGIVRTCGYIDMKSMKEIFQWRTCNPTPTEESMTTMGWRYNEIINRGFFKTDLINMPMYIAIRVADPINIKAFVDQSHGCRYEPRKVIADWGLNFNLGNAVKHLARAGRKGDKIEDLRKAIQYIEFEIEELGGMV